MKLRKQMASTTYTRKRTDVHSPTHMNPEDYTFQFCYYLGSFQPLLGLDTSVNVRRASGLVKGSLCNCHHCGAAIRSGAVMLHKPSGEYICIGETCLDNRFSRTSAEFARMRKQTAEYRKLGRIKCQMNEWLAAQTPEVQAIFALDADLSFLPNDGTQYQVSDIRDKAWNKWGGASDNARDFAMKLVTQAAEREAKKKADAEAHPAVPAPSGLQTITGTVLSIKTVDGFYGTTTKMLVAVDSEQGRWKAWMTVPTTIDGVYSLERGDQITVTVDLTVSNDDPAFAFGKRPRKASATRPEEVAQ